MPEAQHHNQGNPSYSGTIAPLRPVIPPWPSLEDVQGGIPNFISSSTVHDLFERRGFFTHGTTAPPTNDNQRTVAQELIEQIRGPVLDIQQNTDITEEPNGEEFIEIPLIRGFDVISYLWERIKDTNSYIAGGYARYCCSPNIHPAEAKDIDIYSETIDDHNKIKNILNREGLRISSESKYAIEYASPSSGPYHYMLPIHVIKPCSNYTTIGESEQVLSKFDYSICKAAIASPISCLIGKNFVRDELLGYLVIEHIPNPFRTLVRAFKYTNRGYFMPQQEILKLFQCWQQATEEQKQIWLEN